MHILVVDPNEPLAMLLVEELKRMEHTVEQCQSGEEALQLARKQSPELAFLDMALQEPDTVTLAKELREIAPDVRLVLTPFMGEQPVMDESVSIQGVLPKPFFLPELSTWFETVLQSSDEGIELESVEDAGGLPSAEPELELVFEPPLDESSPTKEEVVPAESPSEPVPLAPPPEPLVDIDIDMDAAGFSYEVFAQKRARVERLMNNLAQELAADAVLLTYGGGLLTWVGGLGQAEAESISRAVVHGWRTSAEVARILGREQVRFEQSISGDDYMLYALSVDVNAIMAVAIRGSAPLGLLRHRARSVAEQIADMCT